MKRAIVKCDIYNVLYVPLLNFRKECIKWAIASVEDYDLLSGKKFYSYKRRDGKYYASCTVGERPVTMHEMIMGAKAKEGYVIDHINSNGLDNRRENLRFATLSQNSQNRSKQKGKYSSDYTGVTYRPIDRNYAATIKHKGRYIHIGKFKTELEAAKAYDVYAIHYFGIHSKTNNLLSEDEIRDVLSNGIPSEYVRKKRDLPKNIYRRGDRYSYDVTREGKRYYKSFESLDEAIEGKNNLIKKLEIESKKNSPPKVTEITRNENGVAVVYMRNRKGEIVGECLVDDDTWKDLVRYKIYLRDDGYACGYINKGGVMVHIYLYKKYKGNIPKKYTIDHINNNRLDNRLDNLRTASMSLQSHNQRKFAGAICKYKGVTINGNRFVVNCHGERHSFMYMEEAARKFNEIAIKKYGDHANLNVIEENKQTKVGDLIPDDIDEEYIKNIQYTEMLKQVIKKMGWGGRNGHFNTKKMRITTLEKDKAKAIDLLRSS